MFWGWGESNVRCCSSRQGRGEMKLQQIGNSPDLKFILEILVQLKCSRSKMQRIANRGKIKEEVNNYALVQSE